MDDAKNHPRMMPRDGAGRMTFDGGTGGILHMIGMPGFMAVFKIDRTFHAQSPDNVDPERTKPDVPWVAKVADDVGSSNHIVGRVFIQCANALKNQCLPRGDPERIKVALHTCQEDLRACEKAFQRLANENNAIVKGILEAGGLKVEKRVVPNLPQIPHLEEDATLFLTSAKRALQSIAEVLNQFYGISISNARFDKGGAQLKAMAPVPTEILACLEQHSSLVGRVLDLRNFQEHTP